MKIKLNVLRLRFLKSAIPSNLPSRNESVDKVKNNTRKCLLQRSPIPDFEAECQLEIVEEWELPLYSS